MTYYSQKMGLNNRKIKIYNFIQQQANFIKVSIVFLYVLRINYEKYSDNQKTVEKEDDIKEILKCI